MARDKKKDDLLFNCSQDHEIDYVANLYSGNVQNVKKYLKQKCADGTISGFTHKKVYELIKQDLGLPIPVST